MNFWIHVANTALILSIVSFGTNLLVGFGGVVTLAAGAQFGVGAYTAALLSMHTGLSWPVCIALAMVVTSLISALSAWPALRVRGEYLILLTLALGMMFVGVATSWRSVTNGSTGLIGIERPVIGGQKLLDPIDFLPLIIGATLVAMIVAARVGGSPYGRALRAMRDNESAAVALGKPITGMKFTVFAVSGLFAGFAGGLYAPYQATVNPATFTLDQSIFILAIIVLGGAGSVVGTLVGALLLVSIPEVLRFYDFGTDHAEPMRELIYGVLLIAFMLFRPQGLIPEGAGTRLLRRWRKAAAPPVPDAEAPGGAPPRDSSGAVLLRGTGLSKRFGGIVAAADLDIELTSGRVTALVGPNGAGKTTVFNLLTGFITLDSGRVEMRERDITGVDPARRVDLGLARTFQDVRLFRDLTVLDNVRSAVPRQHGERLSRLLATPLSTVRSERRTTDEAMRCLAFVGMDSRAYVTAENLSYGEQKLVSIARLIATGADVLLLDEPASGVDRAWVDRILDLITRLADQGKAVCLVEHNLDVVRAVAEHAYFMETGRIIAEGRPEDLMEDPRLAEIYFGAGATREGREA